MRRAVSYTLMLLGVLIALFGIGVDYLLPGTSPGLNLPQLLIIGAGLGLSFGAYRFGRTGPRRRSLADAWRGLFSAALITIVTLLVLELVLTATGASTYEPRDTPHGLKQTLHASKCDEAGCRSVYDLVAAACARGEQAGRSCIVNRQGFADDEDFVAREDFARRARVLLLGDSFTQGYSADIGSSFVEVTEARFPEFVMWNAGYTTTGTNQALGSYKLLGPLLKPNLTVLGFYMNDFTDNLTPVDSWYVKEDSKGNHVFVRPFRIDHWGNAIRLDDAAAQYFITYGMYPPANEFERLLGQFRLGTLALRLRDNIAMLQYADRLLAKGVEATRQYLRQLSELTAAQSAKFLVMLIPDRGDLTEASQQYQMAVDLMRELKLPYMTVRDVLKEEDYAPPPDIHWGNAGHAKVGKVLGDCVQVFFESGSLDDCDLVILPE